jgi:hypothetical protein
VGELTAPAVSGATAQALEAGRDRFNALFAAARQARPSLDGATFATHLARRLPPAVDAAERALPGAAGAVTEALYEASLDLLANGALDGGRAGALAPLFEVVLPAVAATLAAAPSQVAAAMCNAALQVAAEPGARLGQWCDLVAGAAAAAGSGAGAGGVGELLDAGLVAAWRAGLAHARAAALDAAARLAPAVAAAALAAPALVDGDLARLAADRWWQPGAGEARELAVVARAGSFRGFGGEFLQPPRVVAAAGGVFEVEGGTGSWWLHADAFGATLRRSGAADPSPPSAGGGGFQIADEGTVTLDGWPGALTVPRLAGASSWVVSGRTLAATTDRSYSVVLVALAPA